MPQPIITTVVTYSLKKATRKLILETLAKIYGDQEILLLCKHPNNDNNCFDNIVRGLHRQSVVVFDEIPTERRDEIWDRIQRSDIHSILRYYNIVDVEGELEIAEVNRVSTSVVESEFDPLVGDELQKVYVDRPKAEAQVYSFEEAISLLKRNNIAMRCVTWPVNHFVSHSGGAMVKADKLWNKFNRKQAIDVGGEAYVSPSFSKNLGGVIEMGWHPTNSDMFEGWVLEGVTFAPTHFSISNVDRQAKTCNLHTTYKLVRHRSIMDVASKYKIPADQLVALSITDLIDMPITAFLTYGDRQLEADIVSHIINGVINHHEMQGCDTHHVIEDVGGVEPDLIHGSFNLLLDCQNDKSLTETPRGLLDCLLENDVKVVVADFDVLDTDSDIFDQLGKWLTLNPTEHKWAGVSLSQILR